MESHAELWIAITVFVLGSLAKFYNVFLLRFDSDEPQHLHVVWGWTRGMVQYRDLFDNHMPLFHLLCAPILGLLGEHARDLFVMRLLMVPLYFLSLWCVYRLGEIAFSRRVGVWAALLASGISVFHFCSTEFRTDDAWIVLWFLCLVTLVREPFGFRSLMAGGLLLGLAFGISMKSTLMLLTIVSAYAIAIGITGFRRLNIQSARLAINVVVFIACMAIIPALIAAYFAAMKVWPQFYDCVFLHNFEPPRKSTYLRPLIFLIATPALMYLTKLITRNESNPTVAFRQGFIGLTCGMYLVLMQSFWRHFTREDYLPLFPLVALVAVALFFKATDWLERHNVLPPLLRRVPLPAIAAFLTMILDLGLRLPLHNEASREINRVENILKVTDRNDLVFDCKGESVFRPRSVRYVLESITNGRIEHGQMADELTKHPVEERARVAVLGGEMPASSLNFMEQNYLPVGRGILVAGYRLGNVLTAGQTIRFRIVMPDRYEVVSPDGLMTGILDGTKFSEARFLAAGEHTFVPDRPGLPLAVLWAQASERHFTNFLTAPAPQPVYQPGSVGKRRIVELADEIPDTFERPVSFRR